MSLLDQYITRCQGKLNLCAFGLLEASIGKESKCRIVLLCWLFSNQSSVPVKSIILISAQPIDLFCGSCHEASQFSLAPQSTPIVSVMVCPLVGATMERLVFLSPAGRHHAIRLLLVPCFPLLLYLQDCSLLLMQYIQRL